jgi:hypothetical protein
MPTKPKLGPSYCPDCYLFDGQDVELPAPRAGATYKCPRGHAWDDIGDLQNRQDLARSKRQQLAPKDPEKEAERAANTTTVPLAAQTTGKEIVIAESDKARIVDLLGIDFTDGSSLCGSIRSLKMDIKALEDELRAAKKIPEPGSADALNPNLKVMESGDMPVTIIVPEQYVSPLKDIAEANGSTIPEYMNTIIANGFDGGWFF